MNVFADVSLSIFLSDRRLDLFISIVDIAKTIRGVYLSINRSDLQRDFNLEFKDCLRYLQEGTAHGDSVKLPYQQEGRFAQKQQSGRVSLQCKIFNAFTFRLSQQARGLALVPILQQATF